MGLAAKSTSAAAHLRNPIISADVRKRFNLEHDNSAQQGQAFSSVSISVVIVAFESRQIIKKAIKSVIGVNEVICVDNASNDGLEDVLAGRQVVYVRSDENVGYARACNRGAEIANGEFILFLNPDVEVGPGAIDALYKAMRQYPDTDVFVPHTVTGDGKTWNRAVTGFEKAQSPSELRLKQDPVGDCCVRFVNGGMFLIRRSTFRALGGFDERIFLYFEDDDLSLRLLAAGYKIIYVHNAMAVHRIGTSSQPVIRYLVHREFHKKRSELYFSEKYGKKTNIMRDLAISSAKIAFYCLTFRLTRALAAYGRLLGAISVRREHDDRS